MKPRVDEREWVEFQWPYLLSFLGGEERVAELAYATGAFVRRREVRSPTDMLRLMCTWAVGGQSLRETAALAAEAGLADVSNVALMKRFARAGDWLGSLLADALGRLQAPNDLIQRLRVMDGSAISRGGGSGTDVRLHLSLDLASHRIDDLELTDRREGESLERFTFKPGDVVLADRGYAHRRALASVAAAGAYFVVRIPWSNVPLETRDGQAFDLLATLRTLGDAVAEDLAVQLRSPDNGELTPCRLVAIRRSEAAAAAARQRALKERKKHGKIDPRTLEAAGYVFVLTNLPEEISATSVLQLYEFRWQIEMKFKTLKSVLHLGELPVRTPELIRVYVTAKLLVALLIDQLIAAAESFSPWGYPIAPHQLVAPESPSL